MVETCVLIKSLKLKILLLIYHADTYLCVGLWREPSCRSLKTAQSVQQSSLGYLMSSGGSLNLLSLEIPLPISHVFLLQFPVFFLQIQTEHLFKTQIPNGTVDQSKKIVTKNIPDS